MAVGVPGIASAAEEAQVESFSFDEDWGSADVQVTIYDGSVHVEANNVRSADGDCIKLKYKVDRRTTYLVPFDAPQRQVDSVGDLARTCQENPSVSGEHDVTLNDDAWVDDVSFEFCEIKRFVNDDCSTARYDPQSGSFELV